MVEHYDRPSSDKELQKRLCGLMNETRCCCLYQLTIALNESKANHFETSDSSAYKVC